MIKFKISTVQPNMPLEQYVLESNLLFVIATEHEQYLGVLGFEILENIMYIRYIYVEESLRKKGIGTQMVRWSDHYAREKKMKGIVWTVSIEQSKKPQVDRFFIKNGFHIPASEEATITVQLDTLSDSYIAKLPLQTENLENHLYRMNQLPLELKADYERRIKPTIIQASKLEEVRGTLIPDLSYALEVNAKIVSYVLFSELQDRLYLNAVYVTTQNATDLIRLLRYCLEIVNKEYMHYQTMQVTLINSEGYRLVEAMLKGAKTHCEIVEITFKTI